MPTGVLSSRFAAIAATESREYFANEAGDRFLPAIRASCSSLIFMSWLSAVREGGSVNLLMGVREVLVVLGGKLIEARLAVSVATGVKFMYGPIVEGR